MAYAPDEWSAIHNEIDAERLRSKLPDYKRTLHTFVIFHEGWELDNAGWVVELEDGARRIVWTSHGGYVIADIQKLSELTAKLEWCLDNMRQAASLAQGFE